jgi:hypothetical protein
MAPKVSLPFKHYTHGTHRTSEAEVTLPNFNDGHESFCHGNLKSVGKYLLESLFFYKM